MGKNIRAIFAANMAALRLSHGYTFERAAELYGVSIRQVAKYEKYGNWPKPDVLDKIADAYGVSVDQLMGRAPLVSADKRPPDHGGTSVA